MAGDVSICSLCGEQAEFMASGPDREHPYRIMCKRDDQICCMTFGYKTREEAIAAWDKHHEDEEATDGR
jgi:hypothetical protein